MRLHALLVLAIGSLLAADNPKEDAAKQEMARLQGTWTFISMEVNGRQSPEDEFGKYRMVLQGDKWTVYARGKMAAQVTFKLDPTRQPKTIDLTSTLGPDKGRLIRGIYTLEGDTLRVCDRGAEKGDRPTEFATKPDSGLVLVVLKRVELQVHRDISYADRRNERQTVDVYAPGEGRNHPVVFWIHGGGWQAGDKADVQVKPRAFVDRGFVFVSTNYRLLPDASIKGMGGDVAKAIRWVHDHAREYGGDPDTFFVMGHSAGAQLAALVCTDDRYLKAEGIKLAIVKGCVPVDGDTYDVPMQIATVEQRRKDAYRRKFGDESHQVDLSPVTHVAGAKGIPPFLILHVADHPETKAQSQRLVKALQEAGIPARAYPAKGKSHGSINADLGKPDDEPTQELFGFLDVTLGKGRGK